MDVLLPLPFAPELGEAAELLLALVPAPEAVEALEGVAVEATGAGVELSLEDECLRSATKYTAASRTTATSAIWKGREIFVIAPSFGISRAGVEQHA